MKEKDTVSEQVDFEVSMKRLEEICAALANENISLEDSLKVYEEGVKLVRLCTQKLEDAERDVRILKVGADGEIVEADFLAQGAQAQGEKA